MRYIYSVLVGLLIAIMALPAFGAALDITFRPGPGDYITSGDFCTTWDEIEAVVNHLDNNNLSDSAVTAAKLANNSVGNLAISAGAVTAIKLAYSDSSTWDTMPVKMYGGEYVGDSTATRRISCGGLRPMRVEIQSYRTDSAVVLIKIDNRWDTTQAFVSYPAGNLQCFSTGVGSITKGDTQFVVNHSNETDTDANFLGRVMLFTVWGY